MHTIRLRRPWDKQFGDGSVVRVDVPDDNVSVDNMSGDKVPKDDGVSGRQVVYRRRFNQPTGLEGKVVRLQISDWQGRVGSLLLNGHSLEVVDSPLEVDVTDQLQRQNEIELTLTANRDRAPRLSGAVTLVISERIPAS